MAENIEKLILDDSGFINPMKESIKVMEEAEKAFKDLSNMQSQGSQKAANEIKKSSDIQKKAIEDVAKAAKVSIMTQEEHSRKIKETAGAMLSSGDTAKKFSELLNKLNTVKLTGAKGDIQDLEQQFTDLISTVKLTDEQIEFLSENIHEVATEMSKIDASNMSEASTYLNKGSVAANEFTSELKDLSNVNVKELEDKLRTLALTTGTNTEEFKETARAIGEYKARITEADRAVEFHAKSSDALSTALGELEDRMYDLALRGQDNTQEFKQLRDEVIRMKTAIVDVDKQVDRFVDKKTGFSSLLENVQLLGAGFQIAEGYTAAFGDENEELQQALLRLNGIMAITQSIEQARNILIEQARTKTGALAVAQGLYNTVVGTSTGVLKVFRLALAATGIGLLIIGLGVLVANWDKVKKSINDNSKAIFEFGKKVTILAPPLNLLIRGIEYLYNNFERLDNIAAGVIDGVVAGLGAIGDVVGKLFKGDFTGAYAAAKEVGNKIGVAVNEGIAEADKEDANTAQAKIIDDLVKGQKKRLEILEAGGKDTAKLQKNILQNELKSLQLSGADKQEIEDKQQEIAVFNAERSKALADKAANESKKRQEDLTNALKKIKELQEELFNISDKTDKEKFDFVKQKNIDQLVLLRNELKKAADVAGKDLTPELKAFDEIIDAAKLKEYVSVVGELPKKLEDISLKSIKPIYFKLKVNVSTDTGDTGDFLDGIENFEDLLQSSLDKLFGSATSGEKAKDFLASASILVNEFGSILNEATDIQLSNIDKQLEQLSDRRETLQDELSKELSDQEKNLANNVGDKQKEVDGILAEEARLNTEKEKLQKEAAKRALVLETAQQAQSLITASIQIYKGFAGLPFGLGIPLAIAAIGSLFAFFAKTKVDAFKATKLYTGAEKISDHFGYGDRHGDTDLPGRGSGYRLVNQRTGLPSNVVISGKEMLLPESVSLPNSEFFHSLRNGMYNGIDLNAAMGFYLNYKGKVQKAQQSTVVVSRNVPQVKERNKIAIPHITKNGRKGMIITTIKDDWQDGKFIEIDF